MLLESKGDLNHADGNGDTALIQAAHNCHISVVEELFNHGVEIDSAALDGVTALITAARNGHSEVVRILLMYGANKELIDWQGLCNLALGLGLGKGSGSE